MYSPVTASPHLKVGHASRMRGLPRSTYRFRVLGMGLAGLMIAAVLHELDAGWMAWTWAGLVCVAWPHIAFLVAIRSADPLRAELRNFMVDSALAGTCLPLMHFNLLPSAVLVTVVCADKVNTGVRGMLVRSLPGLGAAIVLAGLLTGFAIDWPTSTLVILASLPILVIHTLAVSYSTYQLVRKVQTQNVRLADLSQRDALTGLANRRHWEPAANDLLRRVHDHAVPATLMMLDADRFKLINDRHGHGVGDDVLRAIADLLRTLLPDGCAAGRLGGDEFVVALPLAVTEGERIAEMLRRAVEQLEFERAPALRCSISIGLADAPGAGLDLREWLEAADRCLYRAKQGGRNRTESCNSQA